MAKAGQTMWGEVTKADEAYQGKGITKAGHTGLWWVTKAGETFRGEYGQSWSDYLGDVTKADEAYRERE